VNFPYSVTVTASRPAGTDRHGDPLLAATHTVEGCAWAPRSSAEQHDTGNSVIVGRTLYAPAGADISPVDTVTFPDGSRWQVEGDVGDWTSPFTGWAAGIEVALRRVSG